MVALELSLAARNLTLRIRERLADGAALSSQSILWQDASRGRLLIHPPTLVVRLVDGWLLCNLDAETDQTKRQQLQFVFFLGRRGDGDGPQAAATINAPSLLSAQLAAMWGAELQRVLWDAVLDAVEACVHRAEAAHRGQPLTLGGFHVDDDMFRVSVLVGAA